MVRVVANDQTLTWENQRQQLLGILLILKVQEHRKLRDAQVIDGVNRRLGHRVQYQLPHIVHGHFTATATATANWHGLGPTDSQSLHGLRNYQPGRIKRRSTDRMVFIIRSVQNQRRTVETLQNRVYGLMVLFQDHRPGVYGLFANHVVNYEVMRMLEVITEQLEVEILPIVDLYEVNQRLVNFMW
ncbi:hypothetical protein WICPIJ_001315 [Wickerhamomyces pijperi]|uniref:Uncharacterized protein n=1 Tax=Wickerhamomyces pijperi TaxID=599730 RepID=A0A9P8QAZ2_WICPI|nr:hypothetical protein WICPIJ_001315 [Wickerhamomyces pijperi]